MDQINIKINSKPHVCAKQANLEQVVISLYPDLQGVAVGVNQKVISKGQWKEYILQENDDILIIKATCGG